MKLLPLRLSTVIIFTSLVSVLAATEEDWRQIESLVQQDKSAEAVAKIDELLKTNPDDQNLKQMRDKLAPTARPKAAVAGLSEDDQLELDTLIDIAREALASSNPNEQTKLLSEFLEKGKPFVAAHPDQTKIWLLRAVSALALDRPQDGWEAGQKLTALGMKQSQDPQTRQVMAKLNRKGWLNENFSEEARILQQKQIQQEQALIQNRAIFDAIGGDWCKALSYMTVDHDTADRPGFAVGSGCVRFDNSGQEIMAVFDISVDGFNIPAAAEDGILPKGKRRLKRKISVHGRGKLEFCTPTEFKTKFGTEPLNFEKSTDALNGADRICYVKGVSYDLEYETGDKIERKHYSVIQLWLNEDAEGQSLGLGANAANLGERWVNATFRLYLRRPGQVLPSMVWQTKEQIRQAEQEYERKAKAEAEAREAKRKLEEEQEAANERNANTKALGDLLAIISQIDVSNTNSETAALMAQTEKVRNEQDLEKQKEKLQDLFWKCAASRQIHTNDARLLVLDSGLCVLKEYHSGGWKCGQDILRLQVEQQYPQITPLMAEMRSKGWLSPMLPEVSELLAKAHQGDRDAQYNLYFKYRAGDGVQKNTKEERKWLEKAANNGHLEAMNALANCYRFKWQGETLQINQNITTAIQLYEKVAQAPKKKYSSAQAEASAALGEIYDTGEGVEQNHALALQWYLKAFAQGRQLEVLRIAELYESGASGRESSFHAERFYKVFADNTLSELTSGFAYGTHIKKLGDLYSFGKGVPKDKAKADELYKKAFAELSKPNLYPEGVLGEFYELGLGIKRDLPKAFSLYQKAGWKLDVARCYILGIGTSPDYLEGYKHILLYSTYLSRQSEIDKADALKRKALGKLSAEEKKAAEEWMKEQLKEKEKAPAA